MSGLEPQAPSQPTLQQAYETPGNPAEKEPAEQATAAKNANENGGEVVDQRVPTKQTQYVNSMCME